MPAVKRLRGFAAHTPCFNPECSVSIRLHMILYSRASFPFEIDALDRLPCLAISDVIYPRVTFEKINDLPSPLK